MRAPAEAHRSPDPGAIPTRTVCAPLAGNAMAIATDITIGKRNVQNNASGSRTNSRSRASVSSRIGGYVPLRWVSLVTRIPYSSRRWRPVSDMNTSSSVPWCTTTFGAASAAIRFFGVSSAITWPWSTMATRSHSVSASSM